ncbi:DUF2703 domain-containing protein [Falsiroseomonas oryziterrae]|uniref:DUF2703 domain-containing protein n=1 Tax=Falsiroseomonas oryziterrae TaxID=2911368 RepID=UPI001F2B73AB|nr:DUF2703 domain-containing protein [Roseomonas sp. NPKOSM-4]
MQALPIVWQRLTDAAGRTCTRCQATHDEIQRGMGKLRAALRPLGIEPTLEIREIDRQRFGADPQESNRIWIAGRPVEEWLGAQVGSSPCCSVCGDAECRTVAVEDTVFEAIPEELFLRAALIAAGHSIRPGR